MVTRRGGTMAAPEGERLLGGSASKLPPLTLAAGAEDFLRDRVVAAFRAGGEAEGAEFLKLEGDSVDGSRLMEALASISLFGGSRRIWIREVSRLEKGAEDALLAWAAGDGEGARVLATTARAIPELKTLQSLAALATVISCDAGEAEARRWAERLAQEAGLKLPGGALEAIAAGAPNLLAWSQEIDKLRVHARPDGTLPASALETLAGARTAASAERWAAAVIAGDARAARAEAAALDAEGVGGTACLWAVAERALGVLDPQPYGGYRRSGSASGSLGPAAARRALDVVYRADRALKSGEVRDQELREFVEREIASMTSEGPHVGA
jgi:DNA polymerase III delta subunit